MFPPEELEKNREKLFKETVAQAKDVTELDLRRLTYRQDNYLSQVTTYNGSYLEHRLITSIVAIVEQEGYLDRWYKFYLPSLASCSNSKTQDVKKALSKIEKTIESKALLFFSKDRENVAIIPWLAGLIINSQQKFLCVKVNTELAKWIMNLKERYTEEYLSVLFDYRRHGASRLHYFFCSEFNLSTSRMNSVQMESYVKEVKIEIGLLRFLLSFGNADSYERVSSFLEKSLIPALNEINEKEYFEILDPAIALYDGSIIDEKPQGKSKNNYIVNKVGKKITSITFYIKAGKNNTRVEDQRLIEYKKALQKEQEKEEKKNTQLLIAENKSIEQNCVDQKLNLIENKKEVEQDPSNIMNRILELVQSQGNMLNDMEKRMNKAGL